ncbi:MAG: glycosyltransferase [Phycisphaerales bacterium]
MHLSVVIPAHNEETLLPRTLAALAGSIAAARADPALGLTAAEVIVVDDASTDRTGAIAAGAGARVVRIDRRQISASRNAGARAALGDALVFVDADTVVPPAVLREALATLKAGAAGGGAFPRFDGAIPRYARILLPVFLAVVRLSRATGGCFLFCTRAAFDASGGFDETLYATEEVWFCRNIRRRAGRFVILRETVITSARKLRAYSARELLGLLARCAVRPGRIRQREHLGLWYGPRRDDPGGAAPRLP